MSQAAEQTQRRLKVSVVKVGGSLLSRPVLEQSLNDWLDEQSVESIVLIAGGGERVDAIRTLDSQESIGQAAAHWMAIEAMRETAQLLSELVPSAKLVHSLSDLRTCLTCPGRTILDVHPFMQEEEPHLPGEKLPQHWDVTSDSIAARLAIVLGACELVLLKSCSPASDETSLKLLAESGYVDPFLPRLEADLPTVRLVDLPGGREVVWREGRLI